MATITESSPSLFSKLGIGLLCLALFLTPLVGGSPAGPKYQADTFLSLLRVLIFTASLFLLPKTLKKSLWPFCITALLTITSLLAHLKGNTLLFAMVTSTLDWLLFALLFWVISAREKTDKQNLLFSLFAGFTLNALSVLFQAFTNPPESARPQGFFFSPNFSAGFTAFCLPLVLGEFLQAKKLIPQVIFGAFLLIGAGAVVAPASRATPVIALVGIAVTVLLLFVSKQRPNLKTLTIAGVCLLVGMGAMSTSLARRTRDGGKGNENSTAFRVETWKGTFIQAKSNPLFGTGPGTYPYKYPPYAIVSKTDLAHSSYLQVAADLGFPALIALCVGIVGVVVAAIKRPSVMGAGAMGAVTISLLRGIFDSEWAILGNAIPFFAVLGLLIPESKLDLGRPVSSFIAGVFPALGLVFTLLGLRNIWPPVPDLIGNPVEAAQLEPGPRTLIPLARRAEAEGNNTEAIRLLAEASAYDPNNLQTLSILADTQEKAGQKANALQTWGKLAKIYEGPAGKIRALSEQPEIYPAFAYEHLGEWDKAATVIEEYAAMSPVYVNAEIAISKPVALLERRQALREIYTEMVAKTTPEHQAQKAEVLKRLDAVSTQIQALIDQSGENTNINAVQ